MASNTVAKPLGDSTKKRILLCGQYAQATSDYGGPDLIEITVGIDENISSFYIPQIVDPAKNSLLAYYFEMLNMKEKDGLHISADPNEFKDYIAGLFHSLYPRLTHRTGGGGDLCPLYVRMCAHAWVIGWQMGDIEYKTLAMKLLIECFEEYEGGYDLHSPFTMEHLVYVYRHTDPASDLRQFFADVYGKMVAEDADVLFNDTKEFTKIPDMMKDVIEAAHAIKKDSGYLQRQMEGRYSD